MVLHKKEKFQAQPHEIYSALSQLTETAQNGLCSHLTDKKIVYILLPGSCRTRHPPPSPTPTRGVLKKKRLRKSINKNRDSLFKNDEIWGGKPFSKTSSLTENKTFHVWSPLPQKWETLWKPVLSLCSPLVWSPSLYSRVFCEKHLGEFSVISEHSGGHANLQNLMDF